MIDTLQSLALVKPNIPVPSIEKPAQLRLLAFTHALFPQAKVGGRHVRKRKSSSTATEIYRDNRRGRERKSQRKGVRMGAEKRSSR